MFSAGIQAGALFLLGRDAIEGIELGSDVATAADDIISVVHFTDAAGVRTISELGSLRAGTYVTIPAEVDGLTSSQVESALEIQEGKGAFSAKVEVFKSQLVVPENGLVTSGGKIQFQLKEPIIVRSPFTPTQ